MARTSARQAVGFGRAQLPVGLAACTLARSRSGDSLSAPILSLDEEGGAKGT